MHPDNQHILIVRAVEDRNFTFAGRVFMHPPKIIMIQFLLGRHFETIDIGAAG